MHWLVSTLGCVRNTQLTFSVQVYVRKISCPSSSHSPKHDNVPQVKVDMYFDLAGTKSVANLLVVAGMFVAFENDVITSDSDAVKTPTRESSVGGTQKTGFATISKSVRMTHSGALESRLPHLTESSAHVLDPSSQRVCGVLSDSFTGAALKKDEAGAVKGGHSPGTVKHSSAMPRTSEDCSMPLYCRQTQQLPSPPSPPHLTTSPPPLTSSVTPSHLHDPHNDLPHKTPSIKSPFLRLQKLIRTLQTNTADYSY